MLRSGLYPADVRLHLARVRDLTDPRWIKLKGALFLVAGLFAALLLLAERPTWWAAMLLGITVWSFCRAYYFAFYVVERYLDPGVYRFSGLGSLLRYWWGRRGGGTGRPAGADPNAIVDHRPGP